MGSLLNRIGSSYYLKKIEHDSTVLHYKRSPTWRSLVLFTGKKLLAVFIIIQDTIIRHVVCIKVKSMVMPGTYKGLVNETASTMV